MELHIWGFISFIKILNNSNQEFEAHINAKKKKRLNGFWLSVFHKLKNGLDSSLLQFGEHYKKCQSCHHLQHSIIIHHLYM